MDRKRWQVKRKGVVEFSFIDDKLCIYFILISFYKSE